MAPNTSTPTTQSDDDDIQEEVGSTSEQDDDLENAVPSENEPEDEPEAEAASTPEPDEDGENAQSPSYTASIKAPQDASDEELATLARITPGDAEAAALNDPRLAGGKVLKVSLDDENGNVVYSVEVLRDSVSYDAKVDAGTGELLYIDQ